MQFFKSSEILKTGVLPKTGGSYTIGLLSTQHIDQVLDLQSATLQKLSPQEKTFLAKRDRSFLEKHFAAGNLMIGITHKGRLIAQSIVANPATYPGVVSGLVSILKGVIVDQAYRGNGLMTLMVDCWLDIAQQEKRRHALAVVVTANTYSWSVFMQQGLDIQSMGIDPDDGSQIYNMHADVATLRAGMFMPKFNCRSHKGSTLCAKDDLATQEKLLATGYRGVDFDAKQEVIYFKPQPVQSRKRHRNCPKEKAAP